MDSVSMFNNPIDYDNMPGGYQVFGFHGHKHPTNPLDNQTNSLYNKLINRMNVLNGLSWLPVVGIISGIARLVFTYQESKKFEYVDPKSPFKRFLNVNYIRGALEVLSLGFIVFPILDIVFSIRREVFYSQAIKNQNQFKNRLIDNSEIFGPDNNNQDL